MIPPVKNFACIEIDEGANDVPDSPPLSPIFMLNVPLLDSEAVVGIGVGTVADAITIIEGCVDAAPANLH